ncbi:MAG: ABC transporter permease [Candidatus Aminicenantaceae bacterium]
MTFWTIAVNDLKLTIKDKMFFFWLLVFPLLFALIFGMAFPESEGGIRKVTLNVLDHDKSFLSEQLMKELESEKYAVKVLENEEEKSIRTLIIPQNFAKDIISGTKVELILEKEASSNMEASQAAYSNILKAIIKIMSRIILVAPEDETDLKVRYDQHDLERLISLQTEMGGKLHVIPAGFNHSIPAITIMFIIFTILMYGGIILLEERRHGQLERTFLSPATFATILGGKWTSRVIIGMIQTILLFAVGKVLFKIYFGPSILSILLVALFFCGTISGMSILFGSVIKKIEILIILNILVANTMSALGGCWWPLELVPRGIRNLGFIFPTGWAMDAFHKLLFFGYGLSAVLPHIGVLFLFTVIFLILAIKFFKLRKN